MSPALPFPHLPPRPLSSSTQIYIYIIPPFLPSFFHQLVPHHLPTIILTPNFPTTKKREKKGKLATNKHDIPNIKPLQFPSQWENFALPQHTRLASLPTLPSPPPSLTSPTTTTTTTHHKSHSQPPNLPTSQLLGKNKRIKEQEMGMLGMSVVRAWEWSGVGYECIGYFWDGGGDGWGWGWREVEMGHGVVVEEEKGG